MYKNNHKQWKGRHAFVVEGETTKCLVVRQTRRRPHFKCDLATTTTTCEATKCEILDFETKPQLSSNNQLWLNGSNAATANVDIRKQLEKNVIKWEKNAKLNFKITKYQTNRLKRQCNFLLCSVICFDNCFITYIPFENQLIEELLPTPKFATAKRSQWS